MTPSNSKIFFNTLATANPFDVFMGLNALTKLAVLVILVMGIVAIIVALTRRGGDRNGLLSFIGVAAPGLAALIVLYNGLRSFAAYKTIHATHIAIVFPTVIECGQVLILGIIVGLIAMVGNRSK